MSTRPTTLVESDQLAQAAVTVIKNDDFVPKGKRWPFTRLSKAHRDYERTVQEITARRQEAREAALEKKLKKERAEADTIFERARGEAQGIYDAKISEARKPYDQAEGIARAERDAAIAAANLAYQQTMDQVNRVYKEETVEIDQTHQDVISAAKTVHDEAYELLEARRAADLAQIVKDLKTIPLEGPMRVVEDKLAWSPEERKKALIGIVDMVSRDDFDGEYADLCLRNVAGYVFQDRYLKPDAQHHRLMDANLLEALVDLARRCPEKCPTIVRHMHDIVLNNPGHSSPMLIKSLTELYVTVSTDVETLYDADPLENEKIFETLRAHIADTLKLTPRRNQVSPATTTTRPRDSSASSDGDDDHETPLMIRPSDSRRSADITADVDAGELLAAEMTHKLQSSTE